MSVAFLALQADTGDIVRTPGRKDDAASVGLESKGAGTLLAGTTAACIGCGALVGWAAGSVGYGMLAGAMIGIPAGVGAVYVKYKDTV